MFVAPAIAREHGAQSIHELDDNKDDNNHDDPDYILNSIFYVFHVSSAYSVLSLPLHIIQFSELVNPYLRCAIAWYCPVLYGTVWS